LALSTATAAGLASTLSMLAGAGVGPEYLKEHPAALAKVTSEDVLEVASELFAPAHLVAVLLGDATRVRRPLEALGDVSLAEQA
jgi:zinc protease